MQDYAITGDANFICDFSGFKGKLSESVIQWDGKRVLRRFADVRNPQDFLKAMPEGPGPKDARPEATDVYQVGRVLPSDL